MRGTDALIERIVTASEIPSRTRRLELVRELRSHMDDLALAERAAGHSDEEIERVVLERFGDPLQVASNFGWAYRRERAMFRVSVFAVGTAAIAFLITAGVLALQAGLGVNVFGTRHSVIEALDILSTVAGYLGLVSGRSSWKSAAIVSLVFTCLFAALSALGAQALFLIFGLGNAIFLRSVQSVLKSTAAQLAAVVVGFELFAAWAWGFTGASLASWLAMGAGYQLMTAMAGRVAKIRAV